MKSLISFLKLLVLFCALGIINTLYAQDTTTVEKPANADTEVSSSDTTNIYLLEIMNLDEPVGPAITRRVDHAFKQAEKQDADIVMIRLNSFGGGVADADKINSIILNSTIPVYVFINNNAASAGALIAISCDSIYMHPAARMGAVTVVDQTGEPVAEKYQSYMRSTMRSTAEANGRNPEIAEAMVDPRIVVEGIVDSTQLITFTTSEAIKHGYCEGEVRSLEEIYKLAGIENYTIIKHEVSSLDSVIDFLINPALRGILIMIIIMGIYFELQTPGVGFPLIAAGIAAILYFAPHYLGGLAENWEILIFVAGVALLVLEIFVIPGFGVAGILGIICIIGGLALSMVGNVGFDFTPPDVNQLLYSLLTVVGLLFGSILISAIAGFYLIKTPVFGNLILSDVQKKEEGYVSAGREEKKLIGKVGKAATVLRPSGKVEIDGDIYDATAMVGFIDKDESIQVTSYSTGQLFVKKKV